MITSGIVILKNNVIWTGRMKIYRKIRTFINIHAKTSKDCLILRNSTLIKRPPIAETIRYTITNIPTLVTVVITMDGGICKSERKIWEGIKNVIRVAIDAITPKNEMFL